MLQSQFYYTTKLESTAHLANIGKREKFVGDVIELIFNDLSNDV
jgi:hypothetical protein